MSETRERTMRERLIATTVRCIDDWVQHGGGLGEEKIVDAILSELREPDAALMAILLPDKPASEISGKMRDAVKCEWRAAIDATRGEVGSIIDRDAKLSDEQCERLLAMAREKGWNSR